MNTSQASRKLFDKLIAKAIASNPSFVGDGIVDLTSDMISEHNISTDQFIPDVLDYAESKGYELRVSWECAEGEEQDPAFMITDPITFYKPDTLQTICEKIENKKGTMYLICEIYSNAHMYPGLLLYDLSDGERSKYSLLFSQVNMSKTLRELHPDIVSDNQTRINLLPLYENTSSPESDHFLYLIKECYNKDLTESKLPIIKLSEKKRILEMLLSK
jgi:hypothetical protein